MTAIEIRHASRTTGGALLNKNSSLDSKHLSMNVLFRVMECQVPLQKNLTHTDRDLISGESSFSLKLWKAASI